MMKSKIVPLYTAIVYYHLARDQADTRPYTVIHDEACERATALAKSAGLLAGEHKVVLKAQAQEVVWYGALRLESAVKADLVQAVEKIEALINAREHFQLLDETGG